MKRIAILFFICIGTIYSQTYYLNVWSKGSVTSIPVQDIKKLTFADLSSAVGNGEIKTVIKSFKLLQNYPNPFNPSTIIEYQIPKEGNVEIKIFSIDGRLVKIFDNTHSASGLYTVMWDARNDAGHTVASGLYIYRVTFQNSVLAKKMLFVK